MEVEFPPLDTEKSVVLDRGGVTDHTSARYLVRSSILGYFLAMGAPRQASGILNASTSGTASCRKSQQS